MKKLILIYIILINAVVYGQYPIIEEYNPGTTWTFTNGAGIQNYGPPENYATTNIGTTPYPNNSTVTITSPSYNFTASCASNITISFPISGRIENGFDFLYLEYFNAGSWVNLGGFTGFVSGTYTNSTIPNTATRFRFRLVTDATVNTYTTFPPPKTNVYYYDITRFTIDCATILPIDLVEFNGYSKGITNYLYWVTSTETNNDYFTLEKSANGIDWNYLTRIKGGGNMNTPSLYEYTDYKPFNGTSYYRLKQTDFNGSSETFNIIAIRNEMKPNYIVSLGDKAIYLSDEYQYELYNMLGQLISHGKTNIINTSSISSGIYIIKVGVFTEKVIIR